jgi:hypothetical protein
MARFHISHDSSGNKTKEIYTHVGNKKLMRIKNPLGQILRKEGGGNS